MLRMVWWVPENLPTTKIQILQNKTIRVVLNCSPRVHIGFNEFKIINWITVSERVKQIKLNMFRIIHGTARNTYEIHYPWSVMNMTDTLRL